MCPVHHNYYRLCISAFVTGSILPAFARPNATINKHVKHLEGILLTGSQPSPQARLKRWPYPTLLELSDYTRSVPYIIINVLFLYFYILYF